MGGSGEVGKVENAPLGDSDLQKLGGVSISQNLQPATCHLPLELADLKNPGDKFIAARGGRGGFGNAHFKSSVRQTPKFAELGERGENLKLKLELKLVADVGIVGLPNAGKSTFISAVSAARPKIAAYEFTTLVPNLGVAKFHDESLVLCDIPGLISGAAAGRGLGHQFLRHVARNPVLLHLVDCTGENLFEKIETIETELRNFDSNLAEKPRVIALSKIELLPADEIYKLRKSLEEKFNQKIFTVSAVAHRNLPEILGELSQLLKIEKEKNPPPEISDEIKVFRPHLQENSRRWELEKVAEKKWRIRGPRIEQIAAMTDFSNSEAVERLRDVLRKIGAEREILNRGGAAGDEVFFGQNAGKFKFTPAVLRAKKVRKFAEGNYS